MLSFPDAFLVHEDRCFVAGPFDSLPTGHSAITRLIESICASEPDQSRAILRERIFTHLPLTPLCEGMIKVVAKRASVLEEDVFFDQYMEDSAGKTLVYCRAISSDQNFALKDAPKELVSPDAIAQFILQLKPLSERAVGAAIVGQDGNLIAYAWNTHGKNRTQHAELNLLRTMVKNGVERIPLNATVYVTLKPCAMCAAQIFTLAEQISSVKVIYLEDDLGPKAANSVLLSGTDLWKKAGEPHVWLAKFKNRLK